MTTAGKLVFIFNELFSVSHGTVVKASTGDPYYDPGDRPGSQAVIYYANGFAASVLHEVAHWCLAGQKRRQLPDYGYWYKPDGRSVVEQAEFEKVEARPQALEWIFSSAAGLPFFVSADNTAKVSLNLDSFRQRVRMEALSFIARGLPKRANQFLDALTQRFVGRHEFESYWQAIDRHGQLPG